MAKKLSFILALLVIVVALAPMVEAKGIVFPPRQTTTAGVTVVVDFANGAKLFCKTQPGIAVGVWAEGLYYPASAVMPAVGTNCNRTVDPAKEGVAKVTVGGIEVPFLGAFNPTAPFGK